MSKLPALTPREFIQRIKKLGFIEDHRTGSHVVMYNPTTKKRTVIPYHLKALPRGTLAAILRESGVSKDEFQGIK